MTRAPSAGKPAPRELLANIPRLVSAYYALHPDAEEPVERVAFGTSGHRGSSLERTFNEDHIAATSQAVCDYRKQAGIDGPLYIGIDTHALSEPAWATALEVLSANAVRVRYQAGRTYTPTPVVSHAVLTFNRGRTSGLADGIVVTPSHNPPEDGGFKYNPPHGGPAESEVTSRIEQRANAILAGGGKDVKRSALGAALRSEHVEAYDFVEPYVRDLSNVVDLEAAKAGKLKLGVDPMGGASVGFWGRIAEAYGLDLEVVNDEVDPTFRFMTVDWDGQIRMDPSSAYAMTSVIGMKDRFDITFACDTDHDRHGIVTRSAGLLPPNHYLSAAVSYLFLQRPRWRTEAAVGKTVVSSSMIDRVAAKLGRPVYEVPVGFKWFVPGLLSGTLGFGGEESAGASFLRIDGTAWTTDKDGITAALLSAEMTARLGRDPGETYGDLTRELGEPVSDRIEAPATPAQKDRLRVLSPAQIRTESLAGEPIEAIVTRAPGNDASIGGLKVAAKNGWFAARPSGTESIYKIYAESFSGRDHLRRILDDAQAIVDDALSAHA
jgi:phosphoglucomutase